LTDSKKLQMESKKGTERPHPWKGKKKKHRPQWVYGSGKRPESRDPKKFTLGKKSNTLEGGPKKKKKKQGEGLN